MKPGDPILHGTLLQTPQFYANVISQAGKQKGMKNGYVCFYPPVRPPRDPTSLGSKSLLGPRLPVPRPLSWCHSCSPFSFGLGASWIKWNELKLCVAELIERLTWLGSSQSSKSSSMLNSSSRSGKGKAWDRTSSGSTWLGQVEKM